MLGWFGWGFKERINMPYIYQQERVNIYNGIKKNIEKYKLGGSVLDVGAGQVLRYKKLFNNLEVYKTQDVNASRTFQLDYVCDAAHIPEASDSFDVILCTQVLEHVPDPFAICGECCRLLKTGGWFLVSVPQTNEIHEPPHDYFRYTKYGIEELARRSGFGVKEIESLGGYWTMRVRDSQRFLITTFHLYQRPIILCFFSLYYKFRYRISGYMDQWFRNKSYESGFAVGWMALMQKR